MRKLFVVVIVLALLGCTQDERTHPYKDLSILAFIVADNDLDDHAEYVVSDLEKGLRSCPVGTQLIIYLDRLHQPPTLKRYMITADGNIGVNIITTYPEQCSTDPVVFKRVLQDMRSNVAGQRYGLIYWSHGSGWLPGTTKAIGMDSSVSMDVEDLANGMEQVGVAAFTILDACFMGCAPVAYDLRNATDYLIASPAELPGIGFNYRSMLPSLVECTPQSLSHSIDEFMQAVKNDVYGDGVSYAIASVIDCSQMDSLADCMRILLQDSCDSIVVDSIQSFDFGNCHLFYDLRAYAKAIAQDQVKYDMFDEQLNRTVIHEVHTPKIWSSDWTGLISKPVVDFCGLSTYIPGAQGDSFDSVFLMTTWYTVLK